MPAVEPSPTPTLRVEPVLPFDGDCAAVVTEAQRDALLGRGSLSESEQFLLWSPDRLLDIEVSGLGTLGGIECTWYADRATNTVHPGVSAITVTLLPRASVPLDFLERDATPVCGATYDGNVCRASRIDGEVWALASLLSEEKDEGASDLLASVLDAAIANADSSWNAQRADPTEQWWTIGECESLTKKMALDEVIGAYSDGYWEGAETLEQQMLALAGVEKYCPFVSDYETPPAELYVGAVWVMPGAAWHWDAVVSAGTTHSLSIDGAMDARWFQASPEDTVVVYATDGVNMISVVLGTIEVAPTAEAARRALEVLSAP